MERKELIKKYIEFFKSKEHKEISNAPLVPENDPTVLFTTAGMHPLVPYLLGQKHPLGKRLVNVQKCIRTTDIENVGDTTHHTFFEMIGNWSLGDYFKKEAIKWSFEYGTKVLKLKKERLAVSVFGGDKREPNIPIDNESAKIWESLGIPKERIVFLKGSIYESKENWWGPAGKTGPCGPCTEMFYWSPNKIPAPKKFDPEDERWVELWNDVIMEYVKDSQGHYNSAKQKNVDNGRGVERILAAINGLEDNYLTEMWKPMIEKIEKLSAKKYGRNEGETRAMRIIADHLKASAFIIADGIMPSNTEQGYVLRRLIRRAVRYGKELGLKNFTAKVAEPVFKIYDDYEHLQKNKKKILEELKEEEERFNLNLGKGLKIIKRAEQNLQKGLKSSGLKRGLQKGLKEGFEKKLLSGETAFLLYQSYGFPLELTKELSNERGIKVDEKEFETHLKKHQILARLASVKRFKSGLADNSESTTRLHTATHLLLQALKIVLKDSSIIQKGSNITPQRLRLDFNFPRKLTKEEIKEVEDLVNAQIQTSCEVKREEMSPKEAKKKGATGIFDEKYGEVVSVYTIGNFSKEICAGPHIKNLCELGHFKIKKEESSSSGVRRIKAVLE